MHFSFTLATMENEEPLWSQLVKHLLVISVAPNVLEVLINQSSRSMLALTFSSQKNLLVLCSGD